MNSAYRGAPNARAYFENYEAEADLVERELKDEAAIVRTYPGSRDRDLLEAVLNLQDASIRHFDRLLFLSLIDPIMKRYRETCANEDNRTRLEAEREFREAVLPMIAGLIARDVNPILVATLLDPRPYCHHDMKPGRPILQVKNLHASVESAIRRIVETYYDDIARFQTHDVPTKAQRLKSLIDAKTIGVRIAVLSVVRRANWVHELAR